MKVELGEDLPEQQQRTHNETDKVMNLKYRSSFTQYIPVNKDSLSIHLCMFLQEFEAIAGVASAFCWQ